MRPLLKAVWPPDPTDTLKRKVYSPYSNAKDDLIQNLGAYCSFCEWEQPFSALHVEHVQAKDYQENGVAIYAHLKESWDNFLLACVHCNSIKGTKPVDISIHYLPHLTNTWRCITYRQGGLLEVTSSLSASEQILTQQLIDLVGLSRRPGHAQYSDRDRRWQERMTSWDLATRYLAWYEAGRVDGQVICDLATSRGFWSVWVTVFAAYPTICQQLGLAFTGTLPHYNTTDILR